MSMIAVIGLGILAWVLVAIPLALFVGRMIMLRERQRPHRTEPEAPAESTLADVGESIRRPPRWRRRNKT